MWDACEGVWERERREREDEGLGVDDEAASEGVDGPADWRRVVGIFAVRGRSVSPELTF